MKRDNKVSINLTQEEYDVLCKLANLERRSVSELAALIVSDVSLSLLSEKQQQGKMEQARFVPSSGRTTQQKMEIARFIKGA